MKWKTLPPVTKKFSVKEYAKVEPKVQDSEKLLATPWFLFIVVAMCTSVFTSLVILMLVFFRKARFHSIGRSYTVTKL
jgi:hypothetical protein